MPPKFLSRLLVPSYDNGGGKFWDHICYNARLDYPWVTNLMAE